MKVGFIGLGIMGGKMALNVQAAGHDLVVYDVKRGAAEPHLKAGAQWADGPRQVAQQSDIVLTSLPGPPEVEAVGAELLEDLRPDTPWFDLSTNSSTFACRIHALLVVCRL